MLIVNVTAAFVTLALLCLPRCYSQLGSEELLGKDTSKMCLYICHPSPPFPDLVSGLSLAPLLISQGIKVLSLCFRVAIELLTDASSLQ